MRIAVAGAHPQVELIQPLAGPNIYDEWLETYGEGLHHLGSFVADIDAETRAYQERGLDVLQSGTNAPDGSGGFAYFDTISTLGAIVELIEIPATIRPPERVSTA